MIFGKSIEQKTADERTKALRLALGLPRFRILCRLANGRWAFCEHVWEYAQAGLLKDGSLFLWSGSPDSFSPIVRRYLNASIDYVNISIKPVDDRMTWVRLPADEIRAKWGTHANANQGEA